MTVAADTDAIPLLMNDKAGALHPTAGVDELTRLAEQNGVAVTVIATKSPDDTTDTLRRLIREGKKRVAVAGGDGTVACAVQTLAGTGVALGIIPQGTANNFANALKLPQDVGSALRVLSEGVVQSVDLGRIGDLYFTESAGVGLFADAMTMQKPTDKSILHAFYTLFRVFMSARARRVKLFIDDEPHTERAVMCEVANSFRMGYQIPVAPEAKVTDGYLDAVIVGDLTRGELLPYFNAMRKQLHRSLPKVQQIRAKQVRIESRHRMNVHCDDSIIGVAPVTIDCAPGVLNVLMNRL